MAIEINLLQGRDLSRKKEKHKFFKIILIGIMLDLLSCLLMDYWVFNLKERQHYLNQNLRNEIVILNTKLHLISNLKKQTKFMIKQLFFFQQLQASNIARVHLFDELSFLVPEGLYLNRLTGKKNKMILEGLSETNAALSQLINNINQNIWMKEANLIEIKQENPRKKGSQFRLNFLLKVKESENQRDFQDKF